MLETILFPFVLVLDSFITSIAYGTNGIKIPKKCILIISFIGTLFLSFSLFFASIIKILLSEQFCTLLSFLLLLLLGLFQLLNFILHKIIKYNKIISFTLNDVEVIVNIHLNQQKIKTNSSLTLTPKEAVFLAITLSLDSLLSGFGMGLSNTQTWLLLTISFFLNILFTSLGLIIGKRIALSNHDLSWISSVIFFILAFLKLF